MKTERFQPRSTEGLCESDRVFVENRNKKLIEEKAEYQSNLKKWNDGDKTVLNDLNRYEKWQELPLTIPLLTDWKFANFHGYSDVDPYEIIRVVTDKKIEIRSMKTGVAPVNMDKLQFMAGGFCGTFINQREQSWIIEQDEEGTTFFIRLHKNGQWKSSNGSRFILSMFPEKFYDYNF